MAFELIGKAVRRFKLPTVNYGSAPIMIVSAQEGDVKTRYFDITLYDDNGDINLTKYTSAKLYGTMPNGDVLMSTECEISPEGKNVVVQFSGGFTAACGRVACNIVFLNDDSTEQLTSQTFYVIVSSTQSGDLASENNEDYNELLSLLREIAAIEEKIETAETARVGAEEGRVAAEESRAAAENTREANEAQRKTDEQMRQTSETAREASEAARAEEEAKRASAEQTRATNETNREKVETARSTAEEGRVNAEKGRTDAESKRVAAESARATAENKRAEAESVRDTNETARKQSETSRQNAEDVRAEAEQERVTNENARKSAESGRVTAESGRVTAEDARAKAETARATAESNRASEEKKRADAETKRAAAETKRETAESARSSAEQNRVSEFETIKQDCETATQHATEVTEEMQGLIDTFPDFATKVELKAVEDKNIEQDKAISAVQDTANSAVQTVTGSDGVTAVQDGTDVTIKGVQATKDALGVTYLYKAAQCDSFNDDKGALTPAAVKKAIITETSGLDGIFNATPEHRGTMSKEDKAKLDGLSYNDLQRVQAKAYTGSGDTYWYYPIAKILAYDSSGNYASVIITGRVGGWEKTNMSSINAIVSNRSGETGSLIGLGDNTTSALGFVDVVTYRQADKTAIVYLKARSYHAFDLNMQVVQAEYIYDGSHVTTPTGDLKWSASTATNSLYVNTNGGYVKDKKIATEQWVNDQNFSNLADGSVTEAKIKDGAVSKAKLSNDLQGSVDKANSALQSIKGAQSGSGNAVTGVAVSGDTVTVTKDKTFAEQADLTALAGRVTAVAENALPKSGGTIFGKLALELESQEFVKDFPYFLGLSDVDGEEGGKQIRLAHKDGVKNILGLGSLATKSTVGSSDIADGAITNVDINANAAIAQSKIANLTTDLAAKATTTALNAVKTTAEAAIPKTQLGVNGGVATLGSDGKIPEAQLPSYVDDVLEFANKAAFPTKGEGGKIYVALDTNLTYRWSGSAYVEISPSLALGETSSTAYAGNKGKANADDIAALKTRVGNVESKNTSQDSAISAAQTAADDAASAAATAQSTANSRYAKPSGGIPKTDLASAVQTSLNKADSALQSVPAATATKLGGIKIKKGSDGVWDITTT